MSSYYIDNCMSRTSGLQIFSQLTNHLDGVSVDTVSAGLGGDQSALCSLQLVTRDLIGMIQSMLEPGDNNYIQPTETRRNFKLCLEWHPATTLQQPSG